MSHAIYCRSHDEVSIDLARSWCDEQGIGFQLLDGRDELLLHEASALAIDLDCLGLSFREKTLLIRRLCSALLPYPVALATYEDFAPDLMAGAAARGVLVFRTMDRPLFQGLAKAISGDSGSSEVAA